MQVETETDGAGEVEFTGNSGELPIHLNGRHLANHGERHMYPYSRLEGHQNTLGEALGRA